MKSWCADAADEGSVVAFMGHPEDYIEVAEQVHVIDQIFEMYFVNMEYQNGNIGYS